MYGKQQFDLIVEEYRQLYYNGEWPGWYQIEKDFEDEQ